MERANFEIVNNFFKQRSEADKEYQQKLEREKTEIIKCIKFGNCILNKINITDRKNMELVHKPIEIDILKEGLKDKYDVVFDEKSDKFNEVVECIFPSLYQYILLIPKVKTLTPFVIIINTVSDEIPIFDNAVKKINFARTVVYDIINIDDNIKSLSQIKYLRESIKHQYIADKFDDEFINKYLKEYFGNLKVKVHCKANEKLNCEYLDFNFAEFYLILAKDVYNQIAGKLKIGQEYCKEVELFGNNKMFIQCKNEILLINCEVDDVENGERIGDVNVKEEVTKITMTYFSKQIKKEIEFLAHKAVFKEGVLKDFLEV